MNVCEDETLMYVVVQWIQQMTDDRKVVTMCGTQHNIYIYIYIYMRGLVYWVKVFKYKSNTTSHVFARGIDWYILYK